MEVVVVPCLYDNYTYLIINGTQAAVVDPSEAWPVMNIIDDRGLELSTVLCTHHHHDHVGGLPDLLDEYGTEDLDTVQSNYDAVIAALFTLLDRRGLELEDLRTHRPTLEDVFVSLTGKHLRDG